MKAIGIALLHQPVVNRSGEPVVSAVTNLDLHDIARSAKTYGVSRYYIVTPLVDQQELCKKILDHWGRDAQKEHHPDRFEALSIVRVVSSWQDACEDFKSFTETQIYKVATSAKSTQKTMSYDELKLKLHPMDDSKSLMIAFGTAWGLSGGFLKDDVDAVLQPVYGAGGEKGYNHLSVRAAVSVILDRLFGN